MGKPWAWAWAAGWAAASHAAAVANARHATTELSRRRVERDEVELFLEERSAARRSAQAG